MHKNILLMYGEHRPSKEHLLNLKKIGCDYNIIVADSEEIDPDEIDKTEIIFGHRYLRQVIPKASHLKWVQTSGGGIDRLPWKELKERDILLSRATFASNVISQHAYLLAWALIRKIPEILTLQQQKIWDPSMYKKMLPWPKTAMILGFGTIGQSLAILLKAANIKVLGVKKNLDEKSKYHCDMLLDHQSWREHLQKVDMCFLALPLTDSTKGMFDLKAIQALPKHSVLVNVGRGETLDVKSLIQVMNEGHLGGAALDIIEPQPIRSDDPIWSTPRLIISPYVAARYLERFQYFEQYVEKQFRNYTMTGNIENKVDWSSV